MKFVVPSSGSITQNASPVGTPALSSARKPIEGNAEPSVSLIIASLAVSTSVT